LTRKLGLSQYDSDAPYANIEFKPEMVRIPLKQHIGVPAASLVCAGDKVRKGDLIGDVSGDTLGAKIHASIDGVVEAVDDNITIVKR
jgi:Na+-translocating ferredoxin:NAD+ oxidoreductase RnfC subunit